MTDPLLKLIDRRWRCTACGKPCTVVNMKYQNHPMISVWRQSSGGFVYIICNTCGHIFRWHPDGRTHDMTQQEKIDLRDRPYAESSKAEQARIVKSICPND